jgi:hypothetical protein
MKTNFGRVLDLLGLLLISLGLSGCVVAIGSGKHENPPPPPPAVVVTDSADTATIAEIDAARQLNFDNARTAALAQIAERSALAVPVQVHLINVTYRHLDFENSKVLVLTKMIARPDFCDATRHAIVSQLNKLSFDTNRQLILQQINERLKNNTAH